jgi:DNA-directed RNA polymerase sigma subunit (sigma70/sigma32)
LYTTRKRGSQGELKHERKKPKWKTQLRILQKLHDSVQKLESVLQEVWSLVDEIGEDNQFKDLLNKAKKYQAKKQKTDANMEEIIVRLDEYNNRMAQIPEDGTAAVDFEDAIAELLSSKKLLQ